jgi:hypothetical protein
MMEVKSSSKTVVPTRATQLNIPKDSILLSYMWVSLSLSLTHTHTHTRMHTWTHTHPCVRAHAQDGGYSIYTNTGIALTQDTAKLLCGGLKHYDSLPKPGYANNIMTNLGRGHKPSRMISSRLEHLQAAITRGSGRSSVEDCTRE